MESKSLVRPRRQDAYSLWEGGFFFFFYTDVVVLENRLAERALKPSKMSGGSSQPPSVNGTSNDIAGAARLSEDVAELAERWSYSSTSLGSGSQGLNPKPGSHLDPLSANFDARIWVKEFIRITESDPKSAPSRVLGLAFKDLNVFGWGTGAEYQTTTGSVLTDTISYLIRLVRGNRHGRQVDILRGFEGVVEKGEMLLVLGPPGSGCSTLLKTLSGETATLQVSAESYINFRGRHTLPLRQHRADN